MERILFLDILVLTFWVCVLCIYVCIGINIWCMLVYIPNFSSSFWSLAADALISTGLADLGYVYLNIGIFLACFKYLTSILSVLDLFIFMDCR